MRAIAVRTSAVVGLLLGAASIVAGSRVLAGVDHPDYVVLRWLVIYNVAAGIAGVIVGLLLWRSPSRSVGLVRMLAGLHATVLVVLIVLWATSRPVATDSLAAMLLRTGVWTAIALVATWARSRTPVAAR
jgi:hypothetical protein